MRYLPDKETSHRLLCMRRDGWATVSISRIRCRDDIIGSFQSDNRQERLSPAEQKMTPIETLHYPERATPYDTSLTQSTG